ncbi:MAG: hypothetical protein ABEI80_10345 [Haloplanus sp.]
MTDDEPDSDDASEADEAVGGLSKRTLIRLLVGFGIGVPILVEGLTFLGLIRQQVSGGESTETNGTGTTTETDVGVGDDLLPATDRREMLASAVLREGGDRWPLSLTVEVTNTGDTDYKFQLLTVHLDDGAAVSGRASTDRLAPGDQQTITGEWSIPAGTTPRAVDVVGLVYPDGTGSLETVERRTELSKIPVRGG